MNKFNHTIISSVFAVLFAIALLWISVSTPSLLVSVPVFVVFMASVFVYLWRYLLFKEVFSFWLWLRVPLFLLAWFMLFFIVPGGITRALFLIVTIVASFFFISASASKGQQIAWNQYLLTLITVLLAIFGLSFYFLLPGILFLLAIFLFVAFLTRSVVGDVPHANAVKWVASLVIALFSVQLFWVLQFLPLHYSVLAVIEFNLLYLLWSLYYHYLYQTLNKKQIQFNVFLALALSIVVLMSTPWSIQ